MFDKNLVLSILKQIHEAIETIKKRTESVSNAEFLSNSPEGAEKLDGICMLFMAIGESIKNIDKITRGTLLRKYLEIDWNGVKGFRDIIAHHYFDVDAEQVFWIVSHELEPLSKAIQKIIKEIDDNNS
jgi:uncharacterized protein with HEPN domain